MDAKHAPILELLADAIVRRFHYASTFVLRQAWVDAASGERGFFDKMVVQEKRCWSFRRAFLLNLDALALFRNAPRKKTRPRHVASAS